MKQNGALQVIFAFFLGLVLVGFVAIGISTFYPEPSWESQVAHDAWQVNNGIIMLVCATILLAVSLFLPEDQGVLSNGILLGGIFTMLGAVGVTFGAQQGVMRFVVITVALAITVAIGYLKFVRNRRAGAHAASPPSGADATSPETLERLTRLEHKLEAIAKALRE